MKKLMIELLKGTNIQNIDEIIRELNKINYFDSELAKENLEVYKIAAQIAESLDVRDVSNILFYTLLNGCDVLNTLSIDIKSIKMGDFAKVWYKEQVE